MSSTSCPTLQSLTTLLLISYQVFAVSSTPLFGFEKTLVDDDNTISFNLWMSKHGKSYRSIAEQHVRQGVFISNIARWSLLNKIPGGASYGPEDEQYADLTPEEFVRVSTCVGTMASPGSFLSDDGENIESVPIFQHQRSHRRTNTIMLVDWRNVDGVSYVTPVKNQGPHGTCWSFGAAENLEGLNVRQGYPLVNISEQEFISCCSECQGASADATFEWLVNNTDGRPALEDGYPYNGNASIPCHASDAPRAPVRLHSWGRIQDDSTGLPVLFGLNQKGPMGLGVDASCFHGYQRGVIRNCTSAHGINHAVLMVAAGTDVYYNEDIMPTIVDFFVIKNSWGNKWGEDGYVRIEQGKSSRWWGDLNTIYTE